MLSKKMQILMPEVPLFIQVGTHKTCVADFSELELQEIGKAWTKALLSKARKIRKERKKDTVLFPSGQKS